MDIVTLINNPPEPKIILGAWYTIIEHEKRGNNGVVIRHRKMRAVSRHRHVVMFESEQGVRECWTLWDLARCVA